MEMEISGGGEGVTKYLKLSTVRVCRAPINLTIRKRFQKLNFFENHFERLISICYLD